MFNPTRRNRNIGTNIQGYGQDNKLKIATPYGELKSYYERLENYQKEVRIINNHESQNKQEKMLFIVAL